MFGFGKKKSPPDAEISGELERVAPWHRWDMSPGLIFLLRGHARPFCVDGKVGMYVMSQPGDKVTFRTPLQGNPKFNADVVVDGTFRNGTLSARLAGRPV